jgi:hypothetical protein
MMVGLLITKVGSRGRVFAGLAVVVVIFQVFGGFMALNNAFQERLNNPTLKMLDADEVAVGDWARQQTAPDAIFLTGSQQEHPIRILGSRAMLVSDTGQLWSTDIGYGPRLHDVYTMLQGAAGTVGLLQEYGVNYVVIGPHELTDASANRDYYRRYYRKVYTSPSDEYEIFKVS